MPLTMSAVLAGPTASAVARAIASRVAATVLGIAAAPTLPLLIVGAGVIAAQMAVMAWNQSANEKMQDKAMEKYCALPSSERTQGLCATGFTLTWYSTNYYNAFQRIGSAEQIGAYRVTESVRSDGSRFWYIEGFDRGSATQPGRWIELGGTLNQASIQEVQDANPSKKPWAEWPEADRQRAVGLLSDEDFLNGMRAMPLVGQLNPGDVLANDHILSGDPDDTNPARRAPTLIPAGTRVPDPVLDLPATRGDIQNLRNQLLDPTSPLGAGITAGVLAGLSGSLGAGGIAGLGANSRRAADNAEESKRAAVDAKAKAAENGEKLDKQKDKLTKMIEGINVDRILIIMIWWQTLHNAFMLSADIARSLVSGLSIALQALPGDNLLGIPTEDNGQPINLGEKIQREFETWVKGAIGVENYAVMARELTKVNRIYQSASNVMSEVQNITNNLQNLTQMAANNTGKIGNALMRFGVVGDKAYAWMSENADKRTSWWGKANAMLEAGQQVASNFEQAAQSVVEIGTSVEQAKVHAREFGKMVNDTEVKEIRPDGRTRPTTGDNYQDENQAAKAVGLDELRDSVSPDISLDDL